jgi:hypothetical protein
VVYGEIKKFVVTFWVMRHFLFCEVRQELAWTFMIQLRFLGSTEIAIRTHRLKRSDRKSAENSEYPEGMLS